MLNYKENKDEILSVLFAALNQYKDGDSETTALLLRKCFPGESDADDFDDRILLDVHFDLLEESENHGLFLDMSAHDDKFEGLPYNLNYIVWHKAH